MSGFGGQSPSKDGTEGTATVIMILKDKSERSINGCIIRSDENLKYFLDVTSENENTKFFIYFCSAGLPENWKEGLSEYKIMIHRFTKPKDKESFRIPKESAKIMNNHVFLPFNTNFGAASKFPGFLTEHSKTFILDDIECSARNEEFKVLTVAGNDRLAKFFDVKLKLNDKKNIMLRGGQFDKLEDGPILLHNDGTVGWCAKHDNNSGKITWYKFKPGASAVIWKKSVYENLDNSSDEHSEPTGSSNHNETEDTVDHAGPLMKDLIQQDSKVKDCLKSLDYEYRLLSNWRHLADQLKDPAVPQEVKEACKSATIHSPTLEVLGRPDICIKPVQELMDKLNGNGLYRRCDVHLQLSNGIPEADRSKSIEDVLLNKFELMDNIAIKLDSPETRVTKNWKYFALQLGIKKDELDLIERGNNPAEQLLQHVYRTLPSEKKSAGEFRRIIMGFDNRPDLQKFVTDVGIENNNDLRTLEDIIPNDSEEMKKVTALLNKSTGGVKNWKTLARIWGIDDSVYNTFDPPSRLSPTDTLLEWLCNINSQVSVKVFLNILGEKMKRYDIKEELEKIIQN